MNNKHLNQASKILKLAPTQIKRILKMDKRLKKIDDELVDVSVNLEEDLCIVLDDICNLLKVSNSAVVTVMLEDYLKEQKKK